MDFLNIDALLFVLYFFTPGIVALWVHDQIVPSDKRNWGEMAFGLLSYGGFNLLLYTLLTPVIQHLFPVLAVPTIVSSKVIDGTSLLFIDLVLPGSVGFVGGILQRSRGLQKFFGGLFLVPDPTPWDYLFSDRKKVYGVVFRLKSGGMVGGIYERGSYVSTFPHPREMYLRRVCAVSEQGELLGVIPQSEGMLISMDECSFVELFYLPVKPERKSLWKSIRIPFTRLSHGNNSQHLNEKDKALLSRQTLVMSSPSDEVGMSPQPKPQEDKA